MDASTGSTGGLRVTPEMQQILHQSDKFLSTERGGQKLRGLYVQQSLELDAKKLSAFGLCCFVGDLTEARRQIEAGNAPHLEGTETPFKFGYATLVVSGAQRVTRVTGPMMQHSDLLKYLISRGLPVDVPDIVGFTALAHAVMNQFPQVDLARVLLEAGANVNYQNRYGEVALFGAFQHNNTTAIDLLCEFGADLDIKEADGISPMSFYLQCGPQVTATIRKWINKRSGDKAPRVEKKCDNCGKDDLGLKNCAKCRVARYCSVECQRAAWPIHKKTCQPFSASNTITIKPFYETHGLIAPTSTFTRNAFGIPTPPIPSSHQRSAHIPKGLLSESKNLVIKVQVPLNLSTGTTGASRGNLLIYSKKRDFVCAVRRSDGPTAYDRISNVIRTRGVGGAKAYFAAELKSKDELVVKVSEVLAEQPF